MTTRAVSNPVLEIDRNGTRFTVCSWRTLADLHRMSDIIREFDVRIVAVHGAAVDPHTGKDRPSAHLNTAASARLIDELRKNGFEVRRPAARVG